jgi:hypothetical protein
MRWYDIVFGILLIISITDFALAAPVPVQEKLQTRVDVVHMPKDVITVLGKRVNEDSLKMAAEYFKTMLKPAESSDAHASSSLAPPPGQDHGSTDVVQAAAPPKQASSAANPDPLGGPSNPLSTAPESGSLEDGNSVNSDESDVTSTAPESVMSADGYSVKWDKSDGSNKASHGSPMSSEYDPDDESEGAQALKYDTIPVAHPRPGQPTDPDGFDWNHWTEVVNQSPPKEVGQAHEYPNPAASTGGDPGPDDFDWNHWTEVVNQSPPKEVGQAHEYPNPAASTSGDPGPDDFDWNHWTEVVNQSPPKEVGHHEYPNPAASTSGDPGPDDFDWAYWNDVVNQSPQKEVGHTTEGFPKPGQSTGKVTDFNWDDWLDEANPLAASPRIHLTPLRLPTKPDEHLDLKGAYEPLPHTPSPTEFDKDQAVNLPPFPAAPPAEVYTFPHWGDWADEANPLAASPGTRLAPLRLPTKPDEHPDLMAADQPSPYPLSPVNLPPSFKLSPTEVHSYLPDPIPGSVAPPPSLDLGSPREPEQDVIPGPTPSPNPEFNLDSSTPDSQLVDLPALIYGMKGKSIQSEE